MARAYKVRLGDGSEIGPLDPDMLRSWYQRGLIDDDSPVQPDGARRWAALSHLVDLRAWGGPRRRRKRRARPAEVPVTSGTPPHRARSLAAAILFAAGAVGAGLWAVFPASSLPDLEGAPWRELALVQLLLGLSLVPDWDPARRLVRTAVLLLSFALFAAAGVLLVQGLRGRVYLVLLFAWLAAIASFASLAGARLSRLHSLSCLGAVVLGYAGVAYFGYVPPGTGHRQVQDLASSQRRFVSEALGLRADLPEGWYVLERSRLPAGAAAPPDAELLLAHPRSGAFAFLLAERSLRGVTSLDGYLELHRARRRQARPSFEELDATEATVGRLPALRLSARCLADGEPARETALAWRDGWNYFALVAWAPEARSARLREQLDALVRGLAPDGAQADRLAGTAAAVSDAVPILSPRATELLLAPAGETDLSPGEACRRAWAGTLRGRSALDALEQREAARLDALMLAALDPRDRRRLAGYLERLRTGGPTSAEEDLEMARLTRLAVLGLPESSRVRLRVLTEETLASTNRSLTIGE